MVGPLGESQITAKIKPIWMRNYALADNLTFVNLRRDFLRVVSGDSADLMASSDGPRQTFRYQSSQRTTQHIQPFVMPLS